MSLMLNSFGSNTLQEALDGIKGEGFNVLHCSLTGVEIGHIAEAEILSCLRLELTANPLASADELVDSFATRFYIMSDRPAPSLRLYKDHKHLLRVLKADSTGPNKLFAYLAGRLFFEALTREKEVDGAANRFARTQFLIDFQIRLSQLPVGWHQSLTPDDEEVRVADEAIRLMNNVAQLKPSLIEESKAAQRCLEALLRLDAIQNIKNVLYDDGLKNDLIRLRDSDNWVFADLDSLLGRLEADSIVRQSKKKANPEGNAMMLVVALEAIGWTQTRIASLRARYESALHKPSQSDNIKAVLKQLRTYGLDNNVVLDEQVRADIEKVMTRFYNDLDIATWSDNRIAAAKSAAARSGQNKGETKVRHGIVAIKAMKESGLKLRPDLQDKLNQAVKEGRISRPSTSPSKSGKVNPNRSIFSSIISKQSGGLPNIAGLAAKKEDK